MIPQATIRHAINSFVLWRARHRIMSAIPELAELDAKQRMLARSHRKGAAKIIAEKRKVMTAKLQQEVGRHG